MKSHIGRNKYVTNVCIKNSTVNGKFTQIWSSCISCISNVNGPVILQRSGFPRLQDKI